MRSFPLRIQAAAHLAQAALWTVARWALLVWGTANCLGIGLLGHVDRVKRRISHRLPRVSGSFPL